MLWLVVTLHALQIACAVFAEPEHGLPSRCQYVTETEPQKFGAAGGNGGIVFRLLDAENNDSGHCDLDDRKVQSHYPWLKVEAIDQTAPDEWVVSYQLVGLNTGLEQVGAIEAFDEKVLVVQDGIVHLPR